MTLDDFVLDPWRCKVFSSGEMEGDNVLQLLLLLLYSLFHLFNLYGVDEKAFTISPSRYRQPVLLP